MDKNLLQAKTQLIRVQKIVVKRIDYKTIRLV